MMLTTNALTPADETTAPLSGFRGLAWLALALTTVLFAGWTAQNWLALSHMRLPDNDDMMRIAEVRDWLGGQAFRDLYQHRLGPSGGAQMHWSRLADLGPALMIVLLQSLLGSNGAELAMVIGYQAILFFLYLLLAAGIAGRLYGHQVRPTAMMLAALAFPTINLFAPGRIDHHALQILLTLVIVDMLVARPNWRRGAIGGVAAAASMAIGLETAPEIVAAMVGMGLLWALGDRAEDRRALAFAAALAGATGLWYLAAKPTGWPEAWCDGFTPSTLRATMVLAAAWGVLGASGAFLQGWRVRLAAGAAIGALAGVAAWRVSPTCFGGPYGALDPFLQRYWMSNVTEAKGMFDSGDTWGIVVAYAALSGIGSVLAVQRLLVRPFDRRSCAFTLFLVLSTIAAILQIRVTYVLAGIAVLTFAPVIVRARAEGRIGTLAVAWLAGAGVVWSAAARFADVRFSPSVEAARAESRECTSVRTIDAFAALPAGTVMAPIDLGSYIIGMTPHRSIAAGYHRNNAGNMAAYRFFLARPDGARAMARRWSADYVALCLSNMREVNIGGFRGGSLLEQLQGAGPPPAWLQRLPGPPGLRLYRVRTG